MKLNNVCQKIKSNSAHVKNFACKFFNANQIALTGGLLTGITCIAGFFLANTIIDINQQIKNGVSSKEIFSNFDSNKAFTLLFCILVGAAIGLFIKAIMETNLDNKKVLESIKFDNVKPLNENNKQEVQKTV